MTALPKKYSLEEYFELERNSEEKFEFWDGNVWSMSGAQFPHNQISVNLTIDLGSKLREKDGFWANYEYNDLSDIVELRSVLCSIPLNSIYRGVTFPAPEANLSGSGTARSTE